MSISAIIMAGGEGTRLRPLTCDTPKPMVPVLGKPVLSYTLQLLKRHQIIDIGITLQYLPERISKAFGSGAKEGVRLYYYREKVPLGTAGGVLQASRGQHAPKDTFVILSGDGLTDCNLTDAIAYHKQKKALATLVVKRVREPLEYGVVLMDESGLIQRFVEKPGWGEVYSDTVNTGIYLLEPEVLRYIWDDKPCDFGKDLFPMLVAQKKNVYAYTTNAYWCDIGDQSAYVRAQNDFLHGKINLNPGTLISETALIDPDASIDGPCYLGPGARIYAHARLEDGAVIGRNVSVGSHARVSRSVVWEDASIGEGVRIDGSVICRGAQAMRGASMREDSALGDGAVLCAKASLETGVKVWPGKRIDPYVRVTENLVWEGATRPRIYSGAVELPDPATACLLAASFAFAINADRIAVAHDGSTDGIALYRVITGALSAQGVMPVLLDEVMLPVLRRMQRLFHIPAGLFVHQKRLLLLTKDGGMPNRSDQRKVETLFMRQDYTRPFAKKSQPPEFLPDANAIYIGSLLNAFGRDAQAMPHIAVFVEHSAHERPVRRVLASAGIRARVSQGQPAVEKWETGFLLKQHGSAAIVFDAKGVPGDAEQALIGFAALPEDSGDWIVKMDESAMVEQLAEHRKAEVRRVSTLSEVWTNALLEADPNQFDMQFDGIYRILQICRLLQEKGTSLRGLLSSLPPSHRYAQKFSCNLPERGKLLNAIAMEEKEAVLNGGLRIIRGDGWLTVNPDEREPEMVVIGESASMEAARELCGGLIEKLQSLMNQ